MRFRSRLAIPGSVLALLFAMPHIASAQEIKTRTMSFESFDGVDLQGTFYISKNGGGSPSVILLHSPFKDPVKGDWDGLAKTLAGEGYNVVRFDFRGHGKSVDLKDKAKFWQEPINAKYMPTQAMKNNKTISYKDFETKSGYFPMLTNDILAARIELDKYNDAGDANSSTVYIIGATDATTLGMLYLGVEWGRPSEILVNVNLPPKYVPWPRNDWQKIDEVGVDIAGCIWLSGHRHASVPAVTMKNISANNPRLRELNQMLFLHGELDKAPNPDQAYGKFFVNDVLNATAAPPNPKKLDPLKYTQLRDVPKSKNIGVDLLGNGLGTEKLIIDFLATIEKLRKSPGKKPMRYYGKPPPIYFPGLGLTL